MARIVPLLVALSALASQTACTGGLATSSVGRSGTAIHQLSLPIANVFIIEDRGGVVIVDSGDPGDHLRIVKALARLEIDVKRVRLIAITHAHADHLGSAAELSQALGGVPVAIGRADVAIAERGRNPEDMHPVSIVALLIKATLKDQFTPLVPTIAVDRCLNLAAYGVSGQLVVAPGHTPGSIVIRLDDGHAIVGDILGGGYLGGRLGASFPTEHYFQRDRERVAAIIAWLLENGAKRFYVGHGGPLSAEKIHELKRSGKFDPGEKSFTASCSGEHASQSP